MAHFTVDARFAELQIVSLKSVTSPVLELAGMTDRAIGLVAGGFSEFLETLDIRALRVRLIDNLPKIKPSPIKQAVLKLENVNLAIWQPRCISLLPLRTNGVIDQIANPASIGVLELYEVAPLCNLHAGKEKSILAGKDLDLPAVHSHIVPGVELTVPEITNHVFGPVWTEHARHARLLPGGIFVCVAGPACNASGVGPFRYFLGLCQA